MVRIDDILGRIPADWWAHSATFYRREETRTASGQVSGEWVPVEGLEDIPCAIGDVEATNGPGGVAFGGEVVGTYYNAVKCYLKGYFPDVRREYRVSVDGGLKRDLVAVRHAQPAVATEVSWRAVE